MDASTSRSLFEPAQCDEKREQGGEAETIPREEGHAVAGEPADEEFHGEGGGDSGDDAAEGDIGPAEDVDHGGATFVTFIHAGGGERDETEEEAEFGGAARIESGEIAADNGHHRPAGAGPHGDALKETDIESLARGEFGAGVVGDGSGGRASAAVALGPEDKKRAEDLGDDDRFDGEKMFVDPVVEQESEGRGGEEGEDQITKEAKAGGIAAEKAAEHRQHGAPVEEGHGGDRAELDDDRVGVGGEADGERRSGRVFVGRNDEPEGGAIGAAERFVGVEFQSPRGDDEVSSGRNRQVFSDSLDRAEGDGIARGKFGGGCFGCGLGLESRLSERERGE